MELHLWLCRPAHAGALQVVKAVLLTSGGIVLRKAWRGPLHDDAAVQLAAWRGAAAYQRIQRIPWSCTATDSIRMSPSLHTSPASSAKATNLLQDLQG